MSRKITTVVPDGAKAQSELESLNYQNGFYYKHSKNAEGRTIERSTTVTMTSEQFIEHIAMVQTHCFHDWDGDIRSSKTAKKHYGLTIDIDDGLSIADFKQIDEFKNLYYILYTSKSHQVDKKGKGICDRFHVVFPFYHSPDHEAFLPIIEKWAALAKVLSLQNDTIHDNNSTGIFYPSHQKNQAVASTFEYHINNGDGYISETVLDTMLKEANVSVEFFKEIKSRKSNGKRSDFNTNLVEDFDVNDILLASKKIAKLAKDTEWGYKEYVNIGFAIADFEHKNLIDRKMALKAYCIITKSAGITEEMVTRKYESSIFNSGHSITLSSFLQQAQTAGYKKHIIKYREDLQIGNEFLQKNIKLIKEVLFNTDNNFVKNANFIQQNSNRQTIGAQYSFNGGKLYQLGIEYNNETGTYWIHSHSNVRPLGLPFLISELAKKVAIDKSIKASVTAAIGTFITSTFPHEQVLTSVSASLNANLEPLWEKENKPEVKFNGNQYECRNLYNTYTGLASKKQESADKILDLISKVFYNKADRDFYLNWLTLFTYVDKIGTTPVMIFKSKARGTGKSMLLTDIPNRIFKNNVIAEFNSGSFNSYVLSKLVSLSEAGKSSLSTFNTAATTIKNITGSKTVRWNEKNIRESYVPSRSFFVIDSNENVPIRIFDTTDPSNNQFFVLDLKESLTSRYQNWESYYVNQIMMTSEYNSMIAAFREVHLEPRISILKQQLDSRFGLRIPITSAHKRLLGGSISIKDSASAMALYNAVEAGQIGNCLALKDQPITIKTTLDPDVLTIHKNLLHGGFITNAISTSVFDELGVTADIKKRLRNLDILIEPKVKKVNGKTYRGWHIDTQKLISIINNIDPSLSLTFNKEL